MDILPTDITNIIFSYKTQLETYLNKKKLLNQLLNTYEYHYINEIESVLVNTKTREIKEYFLERYKYIYVIVINYVKTYPDYEKEYDIQIYDEWRMSRCNNNIFKCHGNRNYYNNVKHIFYHFYNEHNYKIKKKLNIEFFRYINNRNQ